MLSIDSLTLAKAKEMKALASYLEAKEQEVIRVMMLLHSDI